MARDKDLFEALLDGVLDSWDRNNSMLLNLLRAVPDGGLEARAMEGSPTVGQMFMHYLRLMFLAEDAPEFAGDLHRHPEREAHQRDSARKSW